MPPLRKMLGKIDSPECIALMRLIETQSRDTLAAWAISYAVSHYLPLLEKYNSEAVSLCNETAALCWQHINGQCTLASIKPALRTCREQAAATQHPIAQASARALSTAFATVQTPTNALGYLFYGAAATAYDEAGLNADANVYDALAAQELLQAHRSLQQFAVPDEPNPAKINWNC